MKEVIIATKNAGKAKEFEHIFSQYHITEPNAANLSVIGYGDITSAILPSICRPLLSTTATRLSSL